MLTISELKSAGKSAFMRNYGFSVFAGLILFIVSGDILMSSSSSTSRDVMSFKQESNLDIMLDWVNTNLSFIISSFLISLFLYLLLNLLILSPFYVGGYRFFLVNTDRYASLKELLFAFRHNYFNIIISLFLRELFILLWSLLFLIPGIYKTYCYWLVPSLLADNPDLSATEALSLSEEMMVGYKLSAFLLDLSFIGWNLLKFFTFGLSAILYSNPYYYATKTEFYLTLKQQSMKTP